MIITMLIVGMILGAGGMAMLVSGQVKRTTDLRQELRQAHATIAALEIYVESQKSQIELLKTEFKGRMP